MDEHQLGVTGEGTHYETRCHRRLELVSGVSRRMFAHAGYPGVIHATSDVIAGVKNAETMLLPFATLLSAEAAAESRSLRR